MLATIAIRFSVDVEYKDLKEANYSAAFFIRGGLGSLAPSYKDEDIKLNHSSIEVSRSVFSPKDPEPPTLTDKDIPHLSVNDVNIDEVVTY